MKKNYQDEDDELIEFLPIEILEEIALDIGYPDVIEWCKTNKRLSTICRNDFFWKRLFEKDFPEEFELEKVKKERGKNWKIKVVTKRRKTMAKRALNPWQAFQKSHTAELKSNGEEIPVFNNMGDRMKAMAKEYMRRKRMFK